MDYNLVREGTTVLLPVHHRGGLLFFGDGHALQGDGEAVGAGVETSLDAEVVVEVKKRLKLTGVRLERADWIVSVGAKEGASLNETLEIATMDMLRWLVGGRGLTAGEAHLSLGMQARYDIISFAGSVGVRMPKQ
jgi:acetamidase/formamidase